MKRMLNFFESYQKELKDTLVKIQKLFKKYDIDFCFIGGIAVNQYGHQRSTDDIDILVNRGDLEKIKNIPIGYMRDISGNGKVFNFHDPDVRIEILYSGENAGDIRGPKYSDPVSISDSNTNFIELKYLVFYKVASGLYGERYQDWGDVQNLIQKHNLPLDYLNEFLAYDDIVEKYRKIWGMKNEKGT